MYIETKISLCWLIIFFALHLPNTRESPGSRKISPSTMYLTSCVCFYHSNEIKLVGKFRLTSYFKKFLFTSINHKQSNWEDKPPSSRSFRLILWSTPIVKYKGSCNTQLHNRRNLAHQQHWISFLKILGVYICSTCPSNSFMNLDDKWC